MHGRANAQVTSHAMHYASHFTRHASEEEFTRDLREAQNEMQGGSRAVGSANDAVRDTRDALVKRGEKLQVRRDVVFASYRSNCSWNSLVRDTWAECGRSLAAPSRCGAGRVSRCVLAFTV